MSGFIKKSADITYRDGQLQNESHNKWYRGRLVNLQVDRKTVEAAPEGFCIKWPDKNVVTYVGHEYVEPVRGSVDSPYTFRASMNLQILPGVVNEIYTGVCVGLDTKQALILSLPQNFCELSLIGNTVIHPDLLNSREDGGQIIIRIMNFGKDTLTIQRGEAYLEAMPVATTKMVNGNAYTEM